MNSRIPSKAGRMPDTEQSEEARNPSDNNPEKVPQGSPWVSQATKPPGVVFVDGGDDVRMSDGESISISAGLSLGSLASRQRCERRQALRAAEEQRKREAREQRAAKEAEREEQRRQRDPNAPFTGALTSKTKADLQDIAQALGLTTDGQKKDLLARINAHFEANPSLREDTRFECIFNRARRRAAAQTEDEPSDTTPAASAGPSTFIPLSLPPLPPPLSSNVVNTHPSLYTSPHPTHFSVIHPSLHLPQYFCPPQPMHSTPLPALSSYHHPDVTSINPHNSYQMRD
ncbi:hypothetical protein LshimejAT787_1501300 [Lyophyllum shimeji]|uniref:SAP domain-containing protein n=1 Tax=Lyophyllum shimeji TaxID=47721 RepID=A0A9P3UVA1_LYOSH|nr:hypothetical protein LshimejAT787_1501300 [Lyophyllum shimeji]